jgi:hypothetical protein
VLTWDKEAVWWLALRCRRGEALEWWLMPKKYRLFTTRKWGMNAKCHLNSSTKILSPLAKTKSS